MFRTACNYLQEYVRSGRGRNFNAGGAPDAREDRAGPEGLSYAGAMMLLMLAKHSTPARIKPFARVARATTCGASGGTSCFYGGPPKKSGKHGRVPNNVSAFDKRLLRTGEAMRIMLADLIQYPE